MPRRTHLKIYKTRWHIAVTLFFLIIPFIFLLLFTRLANIGTGSLLKDFGVSGLRLLAAYIISVVLAWIFAVLFYRGRRATVALPIFDVLQSFPTFAALPIATLFWGPSNSTIIFFLVVTIIWPIFFSVISSLKLIRRDWQEAAQVFGLSGQTYLRKFLLPVSVPGLITGSIIGLGEGWEAIIATEIIVQSKTGLGIFFQQFSTNPVITAFAILGFLIVIFSINKLIWLPLLEWSHNKTSD